MDDHFVHGSLIPPPESSPHRRGPVVFAAVAVLALGVLVATFWRQLIATSSLFTPHLSNQTAEQTPPTPDEKVRLLEGASSSASTSGSSSVTPQAKAALLENRGSNASAPAPQMSAEEKAKLLGQ